MIINPKTEIFFMHGGASQFTGTTFGNQLDKAGLVTMAQYSLFTSLIKYLSLNET